MKVFKELNDRLDFFAESIIKEITERSYLDVKEAKSIAKTRLLFALSDCLNIKVSHTQIQRERLIQEYTNNETPNWRKVELNAKLSKINSEIKDENVLSATLKDYDEYKLLRKFVEEKFGSDVLDSFFSALNRK